jgi:hypothetical protein
MIRAVSLGLACAFLSLSAAVAQAPSLGEVKGFEEYRVYFAGSEVGGYPLESVDKSEARRKGHRSAIWNFGYGDCTPAPDSGCGLPVTVQNWSACQRWAGIYPGKPRLFAFHGAKAAWVPTAGSLEIYSGRTTVVIFAHSRDLAKAAARKLREVHQAEAPKRLRAPARGSLRGNLPCQLNPS